MSILISPKLLVKLARSEGLRLMGMADLMPLASDQARLTSWQDAGLAAGLEYMNRRIPSFLEPQTLLPEAKSILSFAIPYSRMPRSELRPGRGRVARYALGKDYHRVLKKSLTRFVRRCQEELGCDISYRICSDSVPLLERAIARRAGLGFIGKNTMLITPGMGSFNFLAELLWNVEVEAVAQAPQGALRLVSSEVVRTGSCGSCTRCIADCPTNAFTGPYSLDAGRCISYLTIEKRGSLSSWERSALGEWVFGCDICQEVCPFNHAPMKSDTPPDVEAFSPRIEDGQLGLAELLNIRTDADFLRRFAGTALMRAKREGLLRNAACVVRNTKAEECLSALELAVTQDPSPVVRATALWARAGFCRAENMINVALRDSHDEVVSMAKECATEL